MNGVQEHIWTTSYGISGRGIAAVLITHGDDNGIVLPPKIAPIQVVIVPVPYKGKEQQINKACKQVADKLENSGYRIELDLRSELTPGNKFYYWELRGVPIRIEIGPRDLSKNVVTIVRRDTLEKQTRNMNDIILGIETLEEEITHDLKIKGEAFMKEHIYRVDNLSEAKNLLKSKSGIVEIPWCGKDKCGHKLEEETEARLLGFPENITKKSYRKCIICEEKAADFVRVAHAY
jgi:prolyl-tRNA synthetase